MGGGCGGGRHVPRRDEGITCQACHGKNQAGQFAAGEVPLRFPKDELCGRCHNNQSVLFADFRDEGEIVRHPQREMLAGNAGAEVPGKNYFNALHTTLVKTDCTQCHYKIGRERKHTFEPTLGACSECHAGLTTFNRPSTDSADFDGNGEVEGVMDEIHGCLTKLREAILAAAPSTSAVLTLDESGGVHNLTYAVQLLHRSYEELTGAAMSADTR